MSAKDFISRRLKAAGCKIVGTAVVANANQLEQDGEVFSEKLTKSVAALGTTTEAIASILGPDVTMTLVDRGADRGVGGYDDILEGITRVLADEPFLPLSPEALSRAQAADELRALCFPNGTGYLKSPFEAQWAELDKLRRVLEGPEAQARVALLGLELETERLLAWIELYGRKLGITAGPQEAQAARLEALVEQWHQDYGQVVVQAYAFYDDDKNLEQVKKRDLFLITYRELLERAREEDRLAREEAKKKKKEQQQPQKG